PHVGSLLLGKVEVVKGSRVEVVGWPGEWSSGGKNAGGKSGYECYSSSYLNSGRDEYCWEFGDFTQLVPGVIKD
nr:hypothetical protein [Tanacetum cinerariifolium]